MSTFLRRLPLSRLLLLCGVVVAFGVGVAALALATGGGPVPPPKPLAEAVHDALAAPRVSGVSARIQLTDHLLEGANLASAGGEASQLASSPLLSGASGRLWIGSDGRARLELQSEKGDTQILWDGHTAQLYDASTNTLYRYTPPSREASGGTGGEGDHKVPTVAQIQEGIDRLSKHANVSDATPTDVAGQPAYTVRVSPREDAGLIAGAELSWDAVHGAPLRAAVYSRGSASPVIELAATEVSYGPVESSTLEFTPPANAKLRDIAPSGATSGSAGSDTPGDSGSTGGGEHAHLTVHGKGLAAIAVIERPVKAGETQSGSQLEGLPKVDINGTSASELPTALGTLLSFERAGVRYLIAGSVTPSAIETFARGL